MIHRPWRPIFTAWLLALGAMILPVHGETYELQEGTFKEVESWPKGTPEHQLQQIRRLIAEKEYDDAVDLADEWIEKNPYHRLLPTALLLRGDAKSHDRNYFKALYDYEHIARAYPDSDAFFVALERELDIAKTFGSGVRRKFWGMRIMPAGEEAEELFIRIQERTPGSRLAERAGKALGDFYYDRKEMGMAAEAYDIFLENHPRSQWRPEAMKKLIDANLATFKGPRFDATGLIEAQQRIEGFKTDYPATAEKVGADALLVRIDESLAQKALVTAQWYDRKDRAVSAKFMYRRVVRDYPGSSAAAEAARRLEEWGETVTPAPDPTPAQPATDTEPKTDTEVETEPAEVPAERPETAPVNPAPDTVPDEPK